MQFSFMSICELYGIDEIFKGINIPDSYDKEVLINTILSECMMYQPLYVELPILNQLIINFFNVHYTDFMKLAYLYDLQYENDYNPIWNKDGSYIEKESYTKDNSFNSNSNENSNSNNINQVSAYDSGDFQNNNKDTLTSNENRTKNDSGKENFNHSIERQEKGNIGVTTTMNMIKEEMNVHKDNSYNKYEIVAKKFYDEFFIHY